MTRHCFAAATVAALAALAACAGPHEPSGREIYLSRCAGCHGVTGRGDGPMAAQLARRPADLTALSQEWQEYPRAHVMAYVHGYFRAGAPGEVMPAFGADLDGPLVPYDIGDGILTPTPLPLIRLAEYLRDLQHEAG